LRGVGLELLTAEDIARRHGGTVIRRRDGFVIVYVRACGEAGGCRRILLWVRKSPVTTAAVDYLRRVLARIPHDEVWLVKLYDEPDYTEEYKDMVARTLKREEADEALQKIKMATVSANKEESP